VAEASAPPHGLAGHLVERDERRVTSARGDDDQISIDERRLADEPRDISRAEILEDVPVTHSRAVGSLQAVKIAILGQHVHAIAVNRRRAAGTWASIVV